MRNFRFLLVMACLLLLATTAYAQPKGKPNPPKKKGTMFQGTIKEKPWTKSSQSYCAQGSEYFVLVQSNGEELVIQNNSTQKLSDFADKQVTIEGKIETKTIKPSNNPMEQRPVNSMIGPDGKEIKEADFTCTVLVVTKIK
ncbi:MAG: hypothetical protein EAZ95_17715 [Bacteroidetes bacterium]|nr:MAG: hypothetical protein EAZ95_17715 [Bacteroidota bacterium]